MLESFNFSVDFGPIFSSYTFSEIKLDLPQALLLFGNTHTHTPAIHESDREAYLKIICDELNIQLIYKGNMNGTSIRRIHDWKNFQTICGTAALMISSFHQCQLNNYHRNEIFH